MVTDVKNCMISPVHRHIKAIVFLMLVYVTFEGQAQQTERSMKIELPQAKPTAVFSQRERITFDLVVVAASVADQNALEHLTVDDWRYDEPNYFADGRVPNIVLHVERKEADGRWESVPFRASSQGGGANLERLEADVAIELFPGSATIQAAMMSRLSREAVAQNKSEEVFQEEMKDLQKAFKTESLGEFRLSATYTGLSRGGGRVILKAPPLEFRIQEAP